MKAYRKYFVMTVKHHFPMDALDLIAATDRNYQIISIDTRFASKSSNPIDRRLDFSAYFLALIKTLDSRGVAYDAIRKISLEIVTEYVRPKNWFQSWLKKLPVKLVDTWFAKLLLKEFATRVSVNESSEGFIARIITDPKETFGLGYGVDILECGICKLFKKYDLEKYASILCEVDEVTSSLAGLNLIRQGTIARGAAKCDFRWSRK